MRTVLLATLAMGAGALILSTPPSRPLTDLNLGDIPIYRVNLDDPPEERWKEVAIATKPLVDLIADPYSKMMNEWHPPQMDAYLAAQKLPEELEREMRGFLKYCPHPKFTMRVLRMLQVSYEADKPHSCSNILAAMPNGTVVHGRNLDYGREPTLENVKKPEGINIESALQKYVFTRGGREIFVSVGSPGWMGIATGIRFADDTGKGWTFSQDTRHPALSEEDWISRSTRVASDGGEIFAWAVRKAMEESADFKTAVQKFEATKFTAQQYFILAGGGPYEGAVITVDEEQSYGQPFNNVEVLSPQIGRWFLVQTNDDLRTEPKDDRRAFGNGVMSTMGQAEVSPETVREIMRTLPLFNPSTTYTTVAVPAQSAFEVFSGWNDTEMEPEMAYYKEHHQLRLPAFLRVSQ